MDVLYNWAKFLFTDHKRVVVLFIEVKRHLVVNQFFSRAIPELSVQVQEELVDVLLVVLLKLKDLALVGAELLLVEGKHLVSALRIDLLEDGLEVL